MRARDSILRKSLPYGAIVFAGICIWSISLLNGFALDDLIQIVENYQLRLADGGWSVLSSPAFPGNLYRPVSFYSYYLQVLTTGMNPLPFHLLNVAFHLINALLVYELLKDRLGSGTGVMAALFFLAHPLAVESVANVSGRAEILATFFVLISILIASRSAPKSIGALFLLAATSFAAAASKESGMVAPLLLGIWVYCLPGSGAARLARVTLSSSFGACCYLFARAVALQGEIYSLRVIDRFDNPLASLPLPQRMVEALALLGSYLAKVLFPFPLSADYSYAVTHYAEEISLYSWVIALLVLGLFVISFVATMRRKISGALMLWFFLAFVLTSNIFFPIGTVMAERLTYLPSIGVLAIVTHGLFAIKLPYIRYIILAAAMLSSACYAISHSPVWADTAMLADYQELISPQSFRTQLLCAARDKNRQKFESALRHLSLAQEILPENDDAYYLRGAIHIETRHYPEAEAAFLDALRVNATHRPTLRLYGRLLVNLGRLDQAQKVVQLLEKLDGEHPEALVIKLALALKRKDRSQAEAAVQNLERLNYQSDDFIQLKRYLGPTE